MVLVGGRLKGWFPLPPTFDGTCSQAHLLTMNLNVAPSPNDSVLKMNQGTLKRFSNFQPDRLVGGNSDIFSAVPAPVAKQLSSLHARMRSMSFHHPFAAISRCGVRQGNVLKRVPHVQHDCPAN